MRRRPPLVFACAAALALLIAACGGDSDAPDRDTGVEATRGDGGEVAGGGYALEPGVPAARFDAMLGFEVVPGSTTEAIVVTQGGQLWRVSLAGDDEPALFADVADRLIDEPGSEEGLLGFAFSPRFSQDNAVYLHYSAGEPRRSVVSRFRVAGDTVDTSSEQVLLEVGQPYPNHNGGQLAFGPDGYLYVGARRWRRSRRSRWQRAELGHAARGDPAARCLRRRCGLRHPFGQPVRGARRRARRDIRLRLPQSLALQLRPGDGRALGRRCRSGALGGDLIASRRAATTAGTSWKASSATRPMSVTTTGMTLPRAAYSHDGGRCAIIGGHVYRGDALPELRGWYVYADYCSGRVWALDTESESEPRLLIEEGPPIASFGVLPDGELIAVTFANELARLVRQP